tara:strand:+ start:2360 stop:4039 length:1680 start_codon:yes stop_codon:yes gene_type:complete
MIKYFPEGESPRPKQRSILESIESSFFNKKKFLIIQAPTGSGKSYIAKTIANAARKSSDSYNELVDSGKIYSSQYISETLSEKTHGCYALTITKTLQDEYTEKFTDTAIFKGKNSYDCMYDEQYKVDNAPCLYLSGIKKNCLSKNLCTYYNSRDETLKSNFATLNYSKFLSMEGHHKRRQYLVLDEASELEAELVKEFTFELPVLFLKNKLGINFKYKIKPIEMLESLRECFYELSEIVNDTKKNIAKKTKSGDSIQANKLKDRYYRYNKIKVGLEALINTYTESKYIIERYIKDKPGIIRFTPLKVDLLSGHIFDYGDKVVLLSATIIGIKSFVKSLGISDDNYDYINIESDFNPSKSPILIYRDTPLNNSTLDKYLPVLVDRIEGILERFPNDKGIIHSQSNYITTQIESIIAKKYSKRLLVRGEFNNEQLLTMHKDSKEPTVIISPSMTYGVDLKDKLARFQIIVKLPFLPLRDKRVMSIKDLDNNWYTYKMLSTLVQACGRSTRGVDDYSTTYIMDSNFLPFVDWSYAVDNNKTRVFNNYNPVLSTYFKKRCINE